MQNLERQEDPVREQRIEMEIVVDAYDASERALGWYYYLDAALEKPFSARVIAVHPLSMLQLDDEVEVQGMLPEHVCESDMFVYVLRRKKRFAIPLSQLQPLTNNAAILQAVADWQYWIGHGYEF